MTIPANLRGDTPGPDLSVLAEALWVSPVVEMPLADLDELGVWSATVDGLAVDELGEGDPVADDC